MGNLIKGPWSLTNSRPSKQIFSKSDLEFVAFDVETTGFNKNDRIIEIGIVAFKGGKVLEEWSTLINPLRDVGKTNIHGITSSMVSTAPLIEEVLNDIFRMINGRVLVAHQFSFDARMLIQELNRANTHGDLGKGFCTMIASRRLLPGTGDSLAATCAELEVTTINAHNALGDARMTMQIFQHLNEDEQEVCPASVEYQKDMNPSRVLTREAFSPEPDDAIDRIKAFTEKVPFPTSDEKFVAYLLLLNMAMQDLVISKNEQAELLAPTGVGKTTILTKIANTAFNLGYNVLQVFFEDNPKIIQRKHFTLWTGIEPDNLVKNKEEVMSKVTEIQESMPNKLVLKKLASDSMTMNQIKNQVRKMIADGNKIDLVMLDYIDCVLPESTSKDEWKAEGSVMRGFEAMCHELDLVGWTATQGNRSSISAEVVTTDQMGGSIKKAQVGHVIISVAKTLQQKEMNLATIAITKSRLGKDGVVFENCKFNNELLEIDTESSVTFLGFEEQQEERKRDRVKELMEKRKQKEEQKQQS